MLAFCSLSLGVMALVFLLVQNEADLWHSRFGWVCAVRAERRTKV